MHSNTYLQGEGQQFHDCLRCEQRAKALKFSRFTNTFAEAIREWNRMNTDYSGNDLNHFQQQRWWHRLVPVSLKYTPWPGINGQSKPRVVQGGWCLWHHYHFSSFLVARLKQRATSESVVAVFTCRQVNNLTLTWVNDKIQNHCLHGY